jgi:hypothetical protein
VRFNPSDDGVRSATVSIASDDPNGVFSFAIAGLGVHPPEIEVSGRGTAIVSGAMTTSTSDGTDFGSVNVDGGIKTRVFLISNFGLGELLLNGSTRVMISGEHGLDFTVRKNPRRTVESQGSTTFSIRFNPSASGVRNAIVTIANDDRNEGTYTFAVSGTGV